MFSLHISIFMSQAVNSANFYPALPIFQIFFYSNENCVHLCYPNNATNQGPLDGAHPRMVTEGHLEKKTKKISIRDQIIIGNKILYYLSKQQP